MNWNPTDRLSTWVNYDFYWTDDTNNSDLSSLNIHALALASRYGITERTGVALRGEYQWWDFGDGPRTSTTGRSPEPSTMRSRRT